MTDARDAIVFKMSGPATVDDIKALIVEIKRKVSSMNWVGEVKHAVALSYWAVGLPGHTSIWLDLELPRDDDAMTTILLDIPELQSVKFHKAYDISKTGVGAKAKPVNRVKKPEKKDVTLNKWGHDEAMIDQRLLFLYSPAAHAEGRKFAEALKGYPFRDRTAKENQTYIEFDIIERLRSKFPAVYEADRLIDGQVTTALRLLAKPENQRFLPDHWHHAFAQMFLPGRHPGSLKSATNIITGWYATRNKLGEEKMRKILGRKLVDAEDETAMDPVIDRAGKGSGGGYVSADKDTYVENVIDTDC